MRPIILSLVLVTISGCASFGGGKPKGTTGKSHDVPVVSERPSISERQRVSRQREAEQAVVGLTRVEGGVAR